MTVREEIINKLMEEESIKKICEKLYDFGWGVSNNSSPLCPDRIVFYARCNTNFNLSTTWESVIEKVVERNNFFESEIPDSLIDIIVFDIQNKLHKLAITF